MSEELMTLADIAGMYQCSHRHARDVITKLVGFPPIAPGSTPRHPRWLRIEVRAFLHRKAARTRINPELATVQL
jgi:hypothetical protein